MSVIAGCSLLNGVLLLSDCRITVERSGVPDVYCDFGKKLFPLTPHVALGFVAKDVLTAGHLVREVLRQIEMKMAAGEESKLHPAVLLRWFPRFFRSAYGVVRQKWGAGFVCFMVGAVIPDRPNVIERQKVVEIMERFRFGKLSAQRNWLPGILVDILKTPADVEKVLLKGVPLGGYLLYAITGFCSTLH